MAENDRPKLIGVCVSTVHQEDRFHLVEALNRHACANGFRLMIFNACQDPMMPESPQVIGEASVFRLIPYEQLSAMIVFPRFLNENPVIFEVIDNCLAVGMPVISIDKQVPGCICFSFAYTDVFERLVDHVIEDHGARSLMMMAGTQDSIFSDDRLLGFKRSLKSHDIPFSDDLVGFGNFWDWPTRETMVRWFEEEKRELPDAIICANDSMAIAVCTYLQTHGYLVPRDCIVTGFDGIKAANFHIPHLTTCRPDYDDMGRQLVDTIIAKLSKKNVPAFITIDFAIVKSQSCGCENITYEHINDAIAALDTDIQNASTREMWMCMLQSYIAQMASLDDLAPAFLEHFVFHSEVFALNTDFQAQDKAVVRMEQGQPFTDEVDIIFHRYFWREYPKRKFQTAKLIPELDLMLDQQNPIIVTAVHFMDYPLGYCVFQPEMNFGECEKIYTFMLSINAALGTYHGQIQIRQMNAKLREVNEELDRLYSHDSMTGLLNRRGFYRELTSQRKDKAGLPMSVIFISADLDGLKYINDNFGHLEGDNAIIAVAHALQRSAAGNEICARFGGDEFAVAAIIPKGTEEDYFTAYNAHFQTYLNSYNAVSENAYTVLASIGYYAEPLTADFDLDLLIKHADDKMYADKRSRKAARGQADTESTEPR